MWILQAAKKKGRVQFEKMLKDCERKRIDLIVTKSIVGLREIR